LLLCILCMTIQNFVELLGFRQFPLNLVKLP
jgi:hypothetical protein